MKKVLIFTAVLAALTTAAYAGPCASSTNMLVLDSMAQNVGCTFNGYTFANFIFSGYNDFSYPGGNTYNPLTGTGGNPNNAANYLVDFAASGASTTVTVRPDPNQPAWQVLLPQSGTTRSEFTFELKYDVTANAGSNNVQTIVAGLNGVTYNSTSSSVGTATATFSKAAVSGTCCAPAPPASVGQLNGPGPLDSATITIDHASGSASQPFAVFSPNTSVQVTDDLSIVLRNVTGGQTTMGVSSISNTFSPIPEPMTLGMIGFGLVGLSLLRRRMKS